MHVFTECEKCRNHTHQVILCDECGKEMMCEAIEIVFGFGHAMDGNDGWNFCTERCLKAWLKRNPDDRRKHRVEKVKKMSKDLEGIVEASR